MIPPGQSPKTVYVDTHHLLENLTIDAGKAGIILDGQNNIIRNNRIIVDSEMAVISAGPGLILENNIIEIRNRLPEAYAHDRRYPEGTLAPIRLVHADGAIIRNNEIRFANGLFKDPLPAAVVLLESQDVLFEGNRISGFTDLVKKDKLSTFRVATTTGAN